MLLSARNVIFRLNTLGSNALSYSRRCYAKGPKGSDPGGAKKKKLDVESDPNILCSRLVGGNYMAEGEDPVLKPDEEYPEWLWDLKLSRESTPLEELSQDDPKYWNKLKKMTLKQNFKLSKGRKL